MHQSRMQPILGPPQRSDPSARSPIQFPLGEAGSLTAGVPSAAWEAAAAPPRDLIVNDSGDLVQLGDLGVGPAQVIERADHLVIELTDLDSGVEAAARRVLVARGPVAVAFRNTAMLAELKAAEWRGSCQAAVSPSTVSRSGKEGWLGRWSKQMSYPGLRRCVRGSRRVGRVPPRRGPSPCPTRARSSTRYSSSPQWSPLPTALSHQLPLRTYTGWV